MNDKFKGYTYPQEYREERKKEFNNDLKDYKSFMQKTGKFLNKTLQEDTDFIVCMDDISFDLIYYYYRINYDKPNKNLENKIYHADTFLKQIIPLILKGDYGYIPNINIFTCYTKSGKEFDLFVKKIEEIIAKEVTGPNKNTYSEFFQNMADPIQLNDFIYQNFIQKIKILSVELLVSYNNSYHFHTSPIITDNYLFLKSEFLISHNYSGHYMYGDFKYNCLSPILHSKAIFPITNDSLSLYLPYDKQKQIDDIKTGIQKLGFVKTTEHCDTKNYYDERYIKIVKANNNVMAIYNVSIKKAFQHIVITPHVITSSINKTDEKDFINKFQDIPEFMSLELLLNYNLLLLIQEISKQKNIIKLENLDIDKINLYLKHDLTNFVETHQTALWNLNYVDNLILNLTHNSKPLFIFSPSNYSLQNINCEIGFENILISEYAFLEKVDNFDRLNPNDKKSETLSTEIYKELSEQKSIYWRDKLKIFIENFSPLNELFFETGAYINNDQDIINIINRLFSFYESGMLDIKRKEDENGKNEYKYSLTTFSDYIYLGRYWFYKSAISKILNEFQHLFNRPISQIILNDAFKWLDDTISNGSTTIQYKDFSIQEIIDKIKEYITITCKIYGFCPTNHIEVIPNLLKDDSPNLMEYLIDSTMIGEHVRNIIEQQGKQKKLRLGDYW